MMSSAPMNLIQKAATKWAGHMRRGAALRSEKDYLAALALIPELAERRQCLVKTLRGLAELYSETGRLQDAVLLFERIGQDAASPTRIFWCDYARLLFRLAEQQLREKQVAAASLSLEQARGIESKAPGHAEMQSLCREGYLAVGTLFEQAGDWVPAELYFARAIEIPPKPSEPDAIQLYSDLAWRAYWRRDFGRCDHWALRINECDSEALHSRQGGRLARAAALLGALGAAAAQNHLSGICDHYFGLAERMLREDAQGAPGELADLLVAWGSCAKNPVLAGSRFQEALHLRESYLGEKHPKTRELRQALGLEGGGFRQGFEHGPTDPPLLRPAFSAARRATAGELKALQRRLVKLAHPDQAKDDGEFEIRNRMMTEINAAVKSGDSAAMARLASSVRLELKRRGWLRVS